MTITDIVSLLFYLFSRFYMKKKRRGSKSEERERERERIY